jgi:hypothetical protein
MTETLLRGLQMQQMPFLYFYAAHFSYLYIHVTHKAQVRQASALADATDAVSVLLCGT